VAAVIKEAQANVAVEEKAVLALQAQLQKAKARLAKASTDDAGVPADSKKQAAEQKEVDQIQAQLKAKKLDLAKAETTLEAAKSSASRAGQSTASPDNEGSSKSDDDSLTLIIVIVAIALVLILVAGVGFVAVARSSTQGSKLHDGTAVFNASQSGVAQSFENPVYDHAPEHRHRMDSEA